MDYQGKDCGLCSEKERWVLTILPEITSKGLLESLRFEVETLTARLIDPDGKLVERPIQIRTHPITGRQCRITFARKEEKEAGADALPESPPAADEQQQCPFCRPQLYRQTPTFPGKWVSGGRFVRGQSILFPTLFPYGRYSGVSLFNDDHFV
jgi:hypothetical protein